MSKAANDGPELRRYLLGIVPPTEIEQIEKQMLLDAAYFDRLWAVEEELIEDYVDEELSEVERIAFENHFLLSDERRERTDAVWLLRKFTRETSEVTRSEEDIGGEGGRSFFRSYWISIPVAAAVIVGIIAAGYLVTRRPPSADERILVSLNRAYRDSRPFEGRISNFDYAPFRGIRGDEDRASLIDLERARSLALESVSERPNAETQHMLARVYLSAREFDKAHQILKEAQQADPKNAEILNDVGVVYLEKSRGARDGNERLTLVADAIDNFDRALAMDPELLPALFNKAIAVETYLPNRAKELWQEYLDRDQVTDWAAEAREHLDALNRRSASGFSTAEELETAFARSFREGNDEKALMIVSQNRELIRAKYLPHKLAGDLTRKNDRNEKLALLTYLGDIEKRLIGDSYAADLASYYANVPEEFLPLLDKAHENVRAGFNLCLDHADFEQARLRFGAARDLFLKAGDVIEAETVANHFIAYCYYNTDRQLLAYDLLQRVNDYCQAKNYAWFRLMNLDFLLGGRERLGYQTFTANEADYQQGVADAVRIGDNYTTLKFLLALIRKNQFIGHEGHTFNNLDKLFTFSKEPNVSERQKIRIFDKAIPIIAKTRFQSFSKEVALESVAFSESDPLFVIGAQINAGVVHMYSGNFATAEEWLSTALTKAISVKEKAPADTVARIYTQMARLKRMQGDLHGSAELYDKSVRILETLNTPVSLYETKKSRLLVYQQLGDKAKVEKDVYSTLRLAEHYRDQILNEQERNSFFDNEQDIYDVAIEHKLESNQNGAAYDFAEISNSRSLLDMLKRGGSIRTQEQEIKIVLNESGSPSKIGQVRAMMPGAVQILQYSLLRDRLVLWIVSKEKFKVISSPVASSELMNDVETYLDLIEANGQSENLSRRLYDRLIAPALPHLDKEKDICLIPDRILFHLPFSSLTAPDGRYLLEDFNLFYSPSASVFINLSERARRRTGAREERILSVGNPTFDINQFPNLKDLPDAELEAREIAKNYLPHAKLLVRNEATKLAFLDGYKDFDVIHFAGHYTAQPDAPLLSKLIMARDPNAEGDNVLTNAELIRGTWPRTRLIVLSACRTGIERYSDGEGLFGLSRTFLSLGVPLVVASQWGVESGATAELMKNFHLFRRQRSLSTTQALRHAQLEMLRSGNGRFRSVYSWGGFAAFGGYAEY